MEPEEISMSGLALQLGNRIRESFPNVTERYYKPRFLLDASGNKGEDQCTLFHSNRYAAKIFFSRSACVYVASYLFFRIEWHPVKTFAGLSFSRSSEQALTLSNKILINGSTQPFQRKKKRN